MSNTAETSLPIHDHADQRDGRWETRPMRTLAEAIREAAAKGMRGEAIVAHLTGVLVAGLESGPGLRADEVRAGVEAMVEVGEIEGR